LCYLNDFINFRLEKIEELRHTYLGELSLQKTVKGKKRKLTLDMRITDSRTDNEFPISDDASASRIERIRDCRRIVTALLDTDLMQQVAKTPMIKPPVTKTNVLKMNNNFKRALALYDFVAAYKGLGYTYEELRHNHAPFADQLADELAEAVNMTVFLAYKYGNDLEDPLCTAYKEEERRRKEEDDKKVAERLERLRKRAHESGKTLEEYALLVDERNRALEKDNEELHVLRQETEALNRRIDELTGEKTDLMRRIASLQAVIEEREREIERLNQKYIEDMAALRNQCEQEKAATVQACQVEIEALRAENAQKLETLKAELTAQMQAAVAERDTRIKEVTGERDEIRGRWEGARHDLEQGLATVKKRTENLDADRQKLTDGYEFKLREAEKRHERAIAEQEKTANAAIDERDRELYMVRAELDGLRSKHGLLKPSVDYTSRERFTELEEEYEAFKRFFNGQWKLTKRAIRQDVYSADKTPPPAPPQADDL
ncbi:MAG: hypothetical protein K2L51_02130, partial [Clostridiales bacterium]|nr:hypothetical protein [Clostridiales bacterium]